MDLAAIPPICEDVFCEECLEEYSDPTLIPDCVDGYCTFIDLLDIGDLNQCDSNGSGEECVVRAGPCCECGVDIFEENLVSINEDKVRRYVQHVCDGTESCEECVPDYEAAGFGPACEARPGSDQGRCTFIGL